MHAELCPICEGKGKVTIDDYGNIVTLGKLGGKCHGCDGRGWVPVPDNPILREAQLERIEARLSGPKFAIHSHPVEVLEAVPSETKCTECDGSMYTGRVWREPLPHADKAQENYKSDPDYIADRAGLGFIEDVLTLLEKQGHDEAWLARQSGIDPSILSAVMESPTDITFVLAAKLAVGLGMMLKVELEDSKPTHYPTPTEPGYYRAKHKRNDDWWQIVEVTVGRNGLVAWFHGNEIARPLEDFEWGPRIPDWRPEVPHA